MSTLMMMRAKVDPAVAAQIANSKPNPSRSWPTRIRTD